MTTSANRVQLKPKNFTRYFAS